jgi:hypothetical protein
MENGKFKIFMEYEKLNNLLKSSSDLHRFPFLPKGEEAHHDDDDDQDEGTVQVEQLFDAVVQVDEVGEDGAQGRAFFSTIKFNFATKK